MSDENQNPKKFSRMSSLEPMVINATPEAAVGEVKDLLNPAELLRDHNVYDLDGIGIGELDFPTLSETHPIKQITQVKANATTSVETCMDKLPVKISEDNITVTTLFRKGIDIIPTKKEQGDYVSSMLNHSKMLKDEEHMRRMVMSEEEHAIKMEVQSEKLKSAREKKRFFHTSYTFV
ncbi:unnamed protein product [Euphydryas editha]|uniref:Uncharacterized protein n=1 Tax=Euphydryas editha TaxID=104508 RepID=A0AAU9TTA5_EUPED|nr:unnamed protein product [Euphydryas editha]